MRRNARTNGFYDGVFPTTSGIEEEDSQYMTRKEEKKKEREMEGFDLVSCGGFGLKEEGGWVWRNNFNCKRRRGSGGGSLACVLAFGVSLSLFSFSGEGEGGGD